MKIFDIEQLNEKLDIKPVTKSGLNDILFSSRVKIGKNIWTSKNYNITVCADGSQLEEGQDYVKNGDDVYYAYKAAERVVPNGWHLPTYKDVEALFISAAGSRDWLLSKSLGGKDIFGFNALYTGYVGTTGAVNGKVCGFGDRSFFWCDDFVDSEGYGYVALKSDYNKLIYDRTKSYIKLPIRLVKNI
jgi:uncharacterized protein (TIGR02145 family)